MNERIRQLYYECQDESQSTESCYQTFAELIVKECVVIVADAVDRREPASTYVGKIKEHFGVE